MATFALTAGVRPTELAAAADVASRATPPDSGISSLVRQVFLSHHGRNRTRVLFVSAGGETNIVEFSMNVGEVLSEISGRWVGLVEGDHHPPEEEKLETGPRLLVRPDFWPKQAVQLGKRLWAIPPEFLTPRSNDDWSRPDRDGIRLDYVLCAAAANHSKLPLFCSYCEAAVLVLTANRTRRQAALRAKEILQQLNVELLGAVLQGREFPIPDFIYQRL